MVDNIKDKVANAGHAVADAVKGAGHKIAEVAQKAAHLATGTCGTAKTTAEIRERMDVIASCGKKVGVVDHVEGGAIKLTKKDSPDDQHHFIPISGVDHVDSHVHLKKNSQETEQSWKSDAASCGCS
jgi:hypothetical protein